MNGEREGARYYDDRQWINVFPPFPGNPEFVATTYTDIDLRAGFFAAGYSTSPAMAINMPNVGAKYPCTFKDADGEFLSGDRSYRLQLPPQIPAKIFWSVTLYDAENASGLANGQPFPSINSMDKPAVNADGSIDIMIGPQKPESPNWFATVPRKGFFVILRLYGPTRAFFDRTWKPERRGEGRQFCARVGSAWRVSTESSTHHFEHAIHQRVGRARVRLHRGALDEARSRRTHSRHHSRHHARWRCVWTRIANAAGRSRRTRRDS